MISPFWLLAVGMGTAFLIATGRAKAVWDVISEKLPDIPFVPATVPCQTGYHFDGALLTCVPNDPTVPPTAPLPNIHNPADCAALNMVWDNALLVCVPRR